MGATLDYLRREWQTALSEGGRMAAVVFADRLDDTGEDEPMRAARLIRLYYDIQDYVRMSQPIPSEWVDEYQSLNASFQAQPTRWLNGGNARFENPMGPFYLKLVADQSDLAMNMDWMNQEPLRELSITYAEGNADLESILSNYRMQTIERIDIQARWGRRSTEYHFLQDGLRKLDAPNLKSVNIRGRMNDRNNLTRVGFIVNRNLPKGCILMIDGRAVATK